MEYVKNNEIVLNVSFEATSNLRLGNDFIEFKARFGGVTREIIVPVEHVVAIYARENGQGMAFPVPAAAGAASASAADEPVPAEPTRGLRLARFEPAPPADPEDPPPAPPGGESPRPALKRIK
jgi:stringent starvation protein B